MPHIPKKVQNTWWKQWKSHRQQLGIGGFNSELFNLEKQPARTFLMPQIQDKTQNTWWNLWKSLSLELRRGGSTREASNLKNQPIYTLIMPHIQKKVQKTWWKLVNSHISRDSSSGWWASTSISKTILSATKFPIILVISSDPLHQFIWNISSPFEKLRTVTTWTLSKKWWCPIL